MLYILSGVLGSVLLNLVHRPSKNQRPAQPPVKQDAAPSQNTESTKADKPATVQVKSEPADKSSTTATPRSTPRRGGKKGKGRQ
jgi:septal ring-binding cell division protein DamX